MSDNVSTRVDGSSGKTIVDMVWDVAPPHGRLSLTGTKQSVPTDVVGTDSDMPPAWAKATLIDPLPCGYATMHFEIDHAWLPFGHALWDSEKKERVLNQLTQFAARLKAEPGVNNAWVLKTLLTPPGRGVAYLQARPQLLTAKFDVVLLVECESPECARALRRGELWRAVLEPLSKEATRFFLLSGSNARCMADVDHSRQGVFLFNYFFADNLATNLAIWEFTAGWFQAETGLDNSTLILPDDDSRAGAEPHAGSSMTTQHSVINHCRWDRLSSVLPSLLFKRSLTSYVLDNFAANQCAANPILYKLHLAP